MFNMTPLSQIHFYSRWHFEWPWLHWRQPHRAFSSSLGTDKLKQIGTVSAAQNICELFEVASSCVTKLVIRSKAGVINWTTERDHPWSLRRSSSTCTYCYVHCLSYGIWKALQTGGRAVACTLLNCRTPSRELPWWWRRRKAAGPDNQR